ncbi:MAG: hypothetical protein ABH877_02485 [bacterium]
MKSTKRQAIALKGDIEDAASFYVMTDKGRCTVGLQRAYKAVERAYRSGSPAALKLAKAAWRRAKKCLVNHTGYSHRPRAK